MRRRLVLLTLAIVTLAAPGVAQETSPPASTDPPTAAELFRQGRAALDEKKYDVACPKFAESQRLDPHVGTLISLAECEEAVGLLARARSYWQQAIDLARSLGDARQAVAKEHFDQIDPRVPRLTLRRVAKGSTEMVVRKDDVEIGEPSLDAPLPVEVGKHTVVVSAPGFESSAMTVEVAEGEAKDVWLELGPALPPRPAPPPVEPPRQAMTLAPVGKGRTPLRPVGLVTGGVGVVGIAVGSVLGILAIAAKSHPPGVCNPVCNADANARNQALGEGNASTVLFLTGGALVAAGAVLFWVAPSVSRDAASLGVRGTF